MIPIDPTEERKKRFEEFPAYLTALRLQLGKTLNRVCEEIREFYPVDPDHYIVPSQLHSAEKGKTRLAPDKLEGLAIIYGIAYREMLFKAGILPDDPTAGVAAWSEETLRHHYFSRLANQQGVKILAEQDKKIIEEALSQLLQKMNAEKSSAKKGNDLIYNVFLDLFIDNRITKLGLDQWSPEKKQDLMKMIESCITTFSKK